MEINNEGLKAIRAKGDGAEGYGDKCYKAKRYRAKGRKAPKCNYNGVENEIANNSPFPPKNQM